MNKTTPPTAKPQTLFEVFWNDGTTISDETTIGLVGFGFWLVGFHFKTYPPLTTGRSSTWRASLLLVNVAFTVFTE